MNGEPACADYIPRNENIQVDDNAPDDTRDNQWRGEERIVVFQAEQEQFLLIAPL